MFAREQLQAELRHLPYWSTLRRHVLQVEDDLLHHVLHVDAPAVEDEREERSMHCANGGFAHSITTVIRNACSSAAGNESL